MKPALVVGLVVIAATASAYGSFWFAHRQSGGMSASPGAEMQQQPSAGAPSRKILYYKSPMGKPDFSAVPKKDEMGMDYLPVYEDEETSPETAASGQAQKPPSDRKILYYRNLMGLPDTSSVPKKDSMGMDYIPVFEAEEQGDQGVVKVSPARDVGGRVIEMTETEYLVRGRGYLRGIADLEQVVLKAEGLTPVLLRDVARGPTNDAA